MRNRLLLASLATSALLVGCAGPVGSEEDARTGWAQTNAALGAGASSAQASNGATAPDEDPVFRAGNAVSVNYEHSCNSGSINYNGNYYFDASNVGSAVEFNYEAEFDKCSDGSLTIDGMLDYALTADTTDTTSNVTYTYKGDLVWSGSVDGSCEIDMTGSVSAGGGSASVSYKGSICGYDAAATLNVTI